MKNLKAKNPKRYAQLITTSMKCITRIIEILCPGPNQKDLLKSLARKKTFRNCERENNSSTVVQNRITSSTVDSDILKSLIQTSFYVMKVVLRGSEYRNK